MTTGPPRARRTDVEAPRARRDDVELVLVRPPSWSPDGIANLDAAHAELRRIGTLGERHIVVLPELVGSAIDDRAYLAALRAITATTGAWLVGGTHHRPETSTNTGYALAPDGTVAHRYDKLNPYGTENDHGIRPGGAITTGRLAGLNVTVLVCADAWYPEHLVTQRDVPELLVVPSFSTTRRPPAFARALWRHLAITRAYEFTTYVALADWRPGTTHHGIPCAGTSGIADPAPHHPGHYFTPAPDRTSFIHHLDLTKLHALRQDRGSRGFTPHHSPTADDAP